MGEPSVRVQPQLFCQPLGIQQVAESRVIGCEREPKLFIGRERILEAVADPLKVLNPCLEVFFRIEQRRGVAHVLTGTRHDLQQPLCTDRGYRFGVEIALLPHLGHDQAPVEIVFERGFLYQLVIGGQWLPAHYPRIDFLHQVFVRRKVRLEQIVEFLAATELFQEPVNLPQQVFVALFDHPSLWSAIADFDTNHQLGAQCRLNIGNIAIFDGRLEFTLGDLVQYLFKGHFRGRDLNVEVDTVSAQCASGLDKRRIGTQGNGSAVKIFEGFDFR